MNEVQKITDYLINWFQNEPMINTISIVPTIEMDANKENIYPLVNIDVLNKTTFEDAISVEYKMTIVQQRDIKPTATDSKLLNDSNFLDNINETTAISTRFFNNLLRQNNPDNIELEDGTTPREDILKNWSRNGLDGVQFTVSLLIPNISPAC